jgi:ATP synthase protein I
MADIEPGNSDERREHESWEESVNHKEKRKLRARRQKDHNIWFGFGMFGVIGWSIVVPTLIGIFAGIWIDNRWPSSLSWTLMLMFIGLIIGCLNAWNWINQESGANRHRKEQDRKDDH